MNKNYLLLVICVATIVASDGNAQPSKWGGVEPAPSTQQPRETKPAPPPPPTASTSCYAYRTRGGDAWQIACYPSTAACASNMADYQRKTPSIEAIGCAAQVYCFTYNAGGKSSACYLDGNACVRARNDFATRASGISACVANSAAGSPRTQVASSAPPPPPPPRPGTSPFAQPVTPPPPPPVASSQSSQPKPPPPPPGATSTVGPPKGPPPPPPPPGKTAPQTAAAAVCDPANVALRPAGAERCFGAVGQACLSQASPGAFQAPPMFWPVAQVASDCRIIEKVSVGSIIHDNCCRLTPDGLYCQRAPGDRIADETSDLPCHREWRKAVYDSLEGRNWPVTFGPYYQNNNGDDMTPASGSKRSVTTFGPLGVQDAPISYAVNEVAATRRLSAPGGTKLEYSDAAFCSSGRFREEGWCDAIGGCSSTKQLCDKLTGCSGGISYTDWDKKRSCGIDPGCVIDKASEASRWNNRVKHWGICS